MDIDWKKVAAKLDEQAKEYRDEILMQPAAEGRHLGTAALVLVGLRNAILVGIAPAVGE